MFGAMMLLIFSLGGGPVPDHVFPIQGLSAISRDAVGSGIDQPVLAGVGALVRSTVGSGVQTTEGPSFVTPTLIEYHWYAANSFGEVLLDFRLNITGGEKCEIQFLISQDKVSHSSSRTTPEQNSPHQTDQISITNPTHRGVWYDLEWRWWSGVESAGYAVVALGAVYIPGPGEEDSQG